MCVVTLGRKRRTGDTVIRLYMSRGRRTGLRTFVRHARVPRHARPQARPPPVPPTTDDARVEFK